MRRTLVVVVLLCVGAALAASAWGTTGGQEARSLTIYSGREQELVEPLFERFEKTTGIDVKVRYGGSTELAATLAEEGGNSPADVFFAQDAGTLGAAAKAGRLERLPAALLRKVPARFRDTGGRWLGTSGRARVVVYNTDVLKPADLPRTIFGFVDPRWKGKIGLAPTNASFHAFVSAMRLTVGDPRTRAWLRGIKANDPKFYEKNTPVVEAVASREIEVGFVNHYYLYLVKAERPKAPIANFFPRRGDPGALVNAAGVGVVTGNDRRAEALSFVRFLLSPWGQRFYSSGAEEAEYPLVAGFKPRKGLPPLAQIHGPAISLGQLGTKLESTLKMLSEEGYTS
ncbi:MAG: iron ABC transporter substrate-binding protein [Actinobacteria bacterium]|nr:iron ABC transporter substrate-binding protein [Actinomycetota bacterium]